MQGLSRRNLLILLAALLDLWLAMLLLGGPDSPADAALGRAFHLPALVPAARLVTRLGDWDLLLPATFAVAAFLALRKAPRRAAIFLLLILASRFAVEGQKAWFARARPDPHGHLVAVHNMAFPSGHAANSMILFLGIAMVAVAPRLRRFAIPLALLLAGAVGLSRLVLAVHWPSDVIGGWAFGAAWVLLFARIAAIRSREQARPSVIVPREGE